METQESKEKAFFFDKFGWVQVQIDKVIHLSQIQIIDMNCDYYKEGQGFIGDPLLADNFKSIEEAGKVVEKLESKGIPCESDYTDSFEDNVANKYGEDVAYALALEAACRFDSAK